MKVSSTTKENSNKKTVDEIWKNLWDIFIEELLNSDILMEEFKNEHTVFAEALD